MTKVFNERKTLKLVKRRTVLLKHFSSPCQLEAVINAIPEADLCYMMVLFAQMGWSADVEVDACTMVLQALGWEHYKIEPKYRQPLKLFAVKRAVVHVPEHVLYVEDGVAYDNRDSMNEPVEGFLVPPKLRRRR